MVRWIGSANGSFQPHGFGTYGGHQSALTVTCVRSGQANALGRTSVQNGFMVNVSYLNFQLTLCFKL